MAMNLVAGVFGVNREAIVKISQDNVRFGAGSVEGISRQPRSMIRRVFDFTKRLLASLIALIIIIMIAGFIQDLAQEVPATLHAAKDGLERTKHDIEFRQQQRQAGNVVIPPQQNPAASNATLVRARAWGPAPGPLVCRSFVELQRYMSAYAAYSSAIKRSEIMKGQDTLILGAIGPAPDPSYYGCVVVEAGTQLWLDPGNAAPVVTTRFADGSYVKGVTMDMMIERK